MKSARRDRIHRSPVAPAFASVAAGIMADRGLNFRFELWWQFAAVALLAALITCTRRSSFLSSVFLLVACVALGGCWHHWNWSCIPDNEISGWASDEGRPVKLVASVVRDPFVIHSNPVDLTPWQASERTVTEIDCQSLFDADSTAIPVAGRARMTVAGRLDGVSVGDQLEIIGVLMRPTAPSNPGEFDRQGWLRSQGIRTTVSADVAEAIRVIRHKESWHDSLTVLRSAVRERAESLIQDHLNSRTAPVAQLFLLGGQVELDRDLRRAFAETGMLHVLAISGMNVGLLWIAMTRVFRVFRFSQRAILLSVSIVLPFYAFITDASPPIVRATITAVALVVGRISRNPSSNWNSLALAALALLVHNPADLFNAGAQLSFLAVLAIQLITPSIKRLPYFNPSNDALADSSLAYRTIFAGFRFVGENLLVGSGIWLFTAPLIASQFHLFSPVGIILNIVLGPLIAVTFWLGYLFLTLGMISPMLFGWIGVPFDFALGGFLSAIEWSARYEIGHRYMPGPPDWWTYGFYVLSVALAILDYSFGRLLWLPRATLAWCVLGLGMTLGRGEKNDLSCTFLSVGHGVSVLVECPNGRTLLYDAGGMTGAVRTARIIEGALWAAGHSRIDAVIVSHADADHCNALPELLEVVPIASLLVHRTFLDWSQPPVAAAIDGASASGVPIRLLSAGQTIQVAPDVYVEVIHPAADFEGSTDNTNSVVLSLQFAGKRILLTGDLELDGLNCVMKLPPLDTDILLSPHHGSLNANTRDLARWATPEYLIVSCRDQAVAERLADRFGDSTEILTTAKYGAIQCRIQSDGEISISSFKNSEIPWTTGR